ncbi:MAG: type IV pilus twitching motility protein PilT [Planctomycetes bacterium]|nr:type IV pilus twitching motility protein PilT [Planctomycetota bacterium]
MAWIDALFQRMVQEGASDLHMTSGSAPMFRLHGEMVVVEGCPVITSEQMQTVLFEITPDDNKKQYLQEHDTDFAYELPGLARFRANLFLDRKGPGAVFRQIPTQILTAEQLNLPKAVMDLCHLSKGLVVVTGPTGSGKSTTLAAMVDHINRTRKDHIITIEDPVEFVHEDKSCRINQREVHRHTQSFKRALRAALREDPDIVLVGEMRDLETVEIAIETAETGHLVFGTLHTNTAMSTVDRIIDQFSADRQSQIRTMLSSSLKGVVAQTLCKRQPKGRVAALEIMIVNTAIASNIREGKTHQLVSAMQTGAKYGMRLLNDSLEELVKQGLVDPMEAYVKSINKEEMSNKLQKLGVKIDLSTPTEAPEGASMPAGPPAATGAQPGNAPRGPLPQPSPQQQGTPLGTQRPQAAPAFDPYGGFKKTR